MVQSVFLARQEVGAKLEGEWHLKTLQQDSGLIVPNVS